MITGEREVCRPEVDHEESKPKSGQLGVKYQGHSNKFLTKENFTVKFYVRRSHFLNMNIPLKVLTL